MPVWADPHVRPGRRDTQCRYPLQLARTAHFAAVRITIDGDSALQRTRDSRGEIVRVVQPVSHGMGCLGGASVTRPHIHPNGGERIARAISKHA